jgi:hypothetical protein
LPEGDREWLEKPLKRDEIDRLKREAKVSDKPEQVHSQAPVPAVATVFTVPSTSVEVGSSAMVSEVVVNAPPTNLEGKVSSSGVAHDDVIGQAFADAAVDGRAEQQMLAKAAPVVPSTGGYQLSNEARASIVGLIPGPGLNVREVVQPPVNCRVAVNDLIALAAILKEHAGMLEAIGNVWCDINIPGQLAQLIANELMGIIVDEKSVSATLQNELIKLH